MIGIRIAANQSWTGNDDHDDDRIIMMIDDRLILYDDHDYYIGILFTL